MKFYYNVHHSPTMAFIPRQKNPVQILPYYMPSLCYDLFFYGLKVDDASAVPTS
jgi:hypothetical protein